MYYLFMVTAFHAALGSQCQTGQDPWEGQDRPGLGPVFQQKKLPGGWLSLNLSLWKKCKRPGVKFAVVKVFTKQ